jgi:hypothetical protein
MICSAQTLCTFKFCFNTLFGHLTFAGAELAGRFPYFEKYPNLKEFII